MGFLDSFTDGLQISPSGFSRPATSKHHHHHHHHTKDSSSSRVRKRHRSRSRSSSRSRGPVSSDSRRRRRGAASPASAPGWGGGGRNDDDYYDRARGALASGLGGLFGGDSDTRHHAASSSRGSFFGLGNTSRSSFFNFGNRSSYYKRSPRHGFMARAYRRLKRLLRDLVHYAKRHPWKVFFLVVMPLLTTGVLGSLLARFGLRIPPSLERMLGMASRAASGDSLGLVSDAVRMAGEFGSGNSSSSRKTSTLSRGYDGDLQWERRSSYRSGGGGGGGGDGDWGNTVADLARRFF
ncbi:hypothetical protein AAL_00316 [Moelleriella libera RCEF 2490]|uniref:Uncharacterized protein n=1 Tax=Moelleriella libera RCEF 2490 TaxID=1081109 RepID=A0A166UQY2_9HYPO|nr:hypothetical protein AAL_00316 [Moelleriella libera RCEF 2490]